MSYESFCDFDAIISILESTNRIFDKIFNKVSRLIFILSNKTKWLKHNLNLTDQKNAIFLDWNIFLQSQPTQDKNTQDYYSFGHFPNTHSNYSSSSSPQINDALFELNANFAGK